MSNLLYETLFGKYLGHPTIFLLLPNGKTISHDSFIRMTARSANALSEMGLSVGERVAVQIDKSPEALAIYAACVQSGLVYLPLNVAYTPAEVSYFIEDSGTKFFICQGSKKDDLAAVAGKSGAMLETLNSDGTGTFTDLTRNKDDSYNTVERDGEDLVALLYTSGTTGRSKGAMLSQNNLLSNAQALVDLWQFTDKDVLLHALPIFHTHGLFVATNVTLVAGGSMIFIPKFDLDTIIENLPNASTMMGVPTFYIRLLNDIRFNNDLGICGFSSPEVPPCWRKRIKNLKHELATEFLSATG